MNTYYVFGRRGAEPAASEVSSDGDGGIRSLARLESRDVDLFAKIEAPDEAALDRHVDSIGLDHEASGHRFPVVSGIEIVALGPVVVLPSRKPPDPFLVFLIVEGDAVLEVLGNAGLSADAVAGARAKDGRLLLEIGADSRQRLQELVKQIAAADGATVTLEAWTRGELLHRAE